MFSFLFWGSLPEMSLAKLFSEENQVVICADDWFWLPDIFSFMSLDDIFHFFTEDAGLFCSEDNRRLVVTAVAVSIPAG